MNTLVAISEETTNLIKFTQKNLLITYLAKGGHYCINNKEYVSKIYQSKQ